MFPAPSLAALPRESRRAGGGSEAWATAGGSLPSPCPSFPARRGESLSPPAALLLTPAWAAHCWWSRGQWGQGVRVSHASMLSSAGLAGGVRAPTFPRAPSCLLEAHWRSALMHSLLSLVPRAHEDPLLPPLTFFPSGLSLADASSRQPTLITPSRALTMDPWL